MSRLAETTGRPVIYNQLGQTLKKPHAWKDHIAMIEESVNAGIRDRYFGAASTTPASVFPLIVRGGQNHLAKVRKNKPGWATLIERELEEINDRFEPRPDGIWPRSLRLQDQGEFAIGYYHQRAAKLSNDKGEAVHADDLHETTDHEGTE